MGQKGRVLELVLASDPNTTNTNWSSGPIELEEVSQQRATFNRVDIRFIYYVHVYMYICMWICAHQCSACKDQKGALDPLKLKFQVFRSSLIWSGN